MYEILKKHINVTCKIVQSITLLAHSWNTSALDLEVECYEFKPSLGYIASFSTARISQS